MKGLIICIGVIAVIIFITRIIAARLDESGEYDDGKAQKIIRRVGIIVPISIFAIIAFFNSFYTISEQTNVVLETFGVPSLVQEAGPHFKIPFIQKKFKVDTTSKKMPIGYTEEDNESVEAECLMITNDYNFVNVDFDVEYIISSPIDYIYSVEKPEVVLKNIMLASIRSSVSQFNVDGVLTTEKANIQLEILEKAQAKLEKENIGITVINVAIQDAEPPTKDIKTAFKKVEDEKQKMDTKITQARQYEAEQIPKSEADADEIIRKAETEKQKRINEATQEVARFEAMYTEYVKDKETTKKRMFFETMEELLPELKVIVDGSEMNLSALYPIETFTTTNGGKENE